MIGDANGTTRTAVNVIHGADKIARFYLGLLRRYGADSLASLQPAMVNGQLGVVSAGWDGGDPSLSSPARVDGFTVRDGLVFATYDIANPEKLAGVRLPGWPPRSQS